MSWIPSRMPVELRPGSFPAARVRIVEMRFKTPWMRSPPNYGISTASVTIPTTLLMTGNGIGSRSGPRTVVTTSGPGKNTSENRLERSADRELEVVSRLVNEERCPGHRPKELLIDSGRVKREIYPERRVQHRHDDLKLDTGAHTQP